MYWLIVLSNAVAIWVFSYLIFKLHSIIIDVSSGQRRLNYEITNLASVINKQRNTISAYQDIINNMFNVTQGYINEMRPERKRFSLSEDGSDGVSK